MKKLFFISCAFSLLCVAGWATSLPIQRLGDAKGESQTEEALLKEVPSDYKFKSVDRCGYIAATSLSSPKANSVTEVSAEWIAPTISTLDVTAGVQIAVGLGKTIVGTIHGVGPSLLLQHGFVFFSVNGLSNVPLNSLPVSQGDHIFGKIIFDGTSNRLILKNKTKNTILDQTFPVDPATTGPADTALWLITDPKNTLNLYALADFHKITMSHCKATINGKTAGIDNRHFKHARLEMISTSDILKAKLSKLEDDGTSFTTTFKHE